MDALNCLTRASTVDGEYEPGNVGYGNQRVLTFDAATATSYQDWDQPSSKCEDWDSQGGRARRQQDRVIRNKAAQPFQANAMMR